MPSPSGRAGVLKEKWADALSCFLFFWGVFAPLFFGSGCQIGDVPSVSVSIHSLKGVDPAEIEFLDLAFFKPGKLTCLQVNVGNYLSDEVEISKYRIPPRVGEKWPVLSIKLDRKGEKIVLDGLTPGRRMMIFAVAFKYESVADLKIPIARACRQNVTIVEGKTTRLTLELKPYNALP